MKHIGNLEVTEKNQSDFSHITEVTGYVYVDGSAKLDALTTVGGYVYVYGSAKLDALTTVGGYVYVDGSAKLDALKLEKQNDETAKGRCQAALSASFAARFLIKIDGILSWIIGKKSLGEITVFEIKIVGKLKTSFAVQRGESFSHGETVEKAIEDLRYKISDRDTSRFESWTLKTEVSIEEAIQSYRLITGACEFGTKHFCNSIELPEKITVSEIIKKTKGQFGNLEYQKFFEARA